MTEPLLQETELREATPTCVDCGAMYVVPAPEAELYLQRGLALPDRCPKCRAKRRAERHGERLQDRDRGASRFAVNDLGTYGGVAPVASPSRQGPPAKRYPATCFRCGAETTVPFEPRRGRAVYCRPCFEAKRGS